ncbi:hypothetical protein ABPG75_007387 [Micractinium tetrahymenae]
MFIDLEQDDLGRAPPPKYAFTCDTPLRQPKHKPKGGKPRPRPRSQRRGASPADLDGEEAAQLEAQLGVAPAELPPHLQRYALQRRSAASFSGPGVLPGEVEAGRVEYKLRLVDPQPARFQQLVTQLNWRLAEGAGEAIYCLGVEDNGHPRGLEEDEMAASLGVLRAMAAEVGAAAEVLQMPPGSAEGRRCAVVRVSRPSGAAPAHVDLRVAVAGGVDSGKSTLCGVLCHGAGGSPALDNGRGSSRMQVLRHKHELEMGHTSSISLQQLAYDADGNVLNYRGQSGQGSAELARCAARLLRLLDLGGHERFSKTALHGLTCMLPDYALLCVNAATGMSWVTREHLAVAIALGIPLFIALTKSDLASEAAVQQVATEIRALLFAAVEQGCGAVEDPAALAPLVRSPEQAVQLAAQMRSSCIASPGTSLLVPLFAMSAVTGASLPLLHTFLNALQPRGSDSGADGMQGWRPAGSSGCAAAAGGSRGAQPSAHFQIDSTFEVADVGTVFSGTVVSGCVAVGSELLLGPLEGGCFRRVQVISIHRSKVPVQLAQQGQHATLAVQPLEAPGPEAATPPGLAAAASSALLGAEQPARADSASCLHAWMMQEGGGAAQQRPSGSAAVAIGGAGSHGLATSRSAAQLGSSSGRQQQQQSLGSLGLEHRWGSSPLLTASSGPAPRPRKGSVLLDPSLEPQACTEFEAVLVLLGGHWPARGLLSGCYPPEGECDEPDPHLSPAGTPLARSLGTSAASDSGDCGLAAAGGSLGARQPSLGKRSSSRRHGGSLSYIPVVHCGSIRQAARVVAMRELPAARGGWAQGADAGGDGTAGGGTLGDGASTFLNGDVFDSLADLLGGPEDVARAGAGQGRAEAEEEDPLATLAAGDLFAEPSGSSSCCRAAVSLGGADAGHSSSTSALQPDLRQLAGAVAAAGVLLPLQPPQGGTPAGSCPGGSATASASSGHASGGEAPVSSCAAAGAAGAAARDSPGSQLAAALQRQCSLAGWQDIGCVAAVTFRWMHNPEWLVEGARLIVRDRTTGRTSGAGYVTSDSLQQAQQAQQQPEQQQQQPPPSPPPLPPPPPPLAGSAAGVADSAAAPGSPAPAEGGHAGNGSSAGAPADAAVDFWRVPLDQLRSGGGVAGAAAGTPPAAAQEPASSAATVQQPASSAAAAAAEDALEEVGQADADSGAARGSTAPVAPASNTDAAPAAPAAAAGVMAAADEGRLRSPSPTPARRQASPLDNAEPEGWLGRLQRMGRRPPTAAGRRDADA